MERAEARVYRNMGRLFFLLALSVWALQFGLALQGCSSHGPSEPDASARDASQVAWLLDASEPDAQLDGSVSDASGPDAAPRDAELYPDASEPDAQLDGSVSDASGPDAAEPDAALGPDASEPTGPTCAAGGIEGSLCEHGCARVCEWCGVPGCGFVCCEDPAYPGGALLCECAP